MFNVGDRVLHKCSLYECKYNNKCGVVIDIRGSCIEVTFNDGITMCINKDYYQLSLKTFEEQMYQELLKLLRGE